MTRMLRHGALAGAAGGAALALVLRLVGEPAIARAIALEAERQGAVASDEMLGRGAHQAGGVVGALVYGVLLGIVLAVGLASVRSRMEARHEWRKAMLVAAVGFVSVALVPFLKYPANPPGVGDPGTVARRAGLFVVVLSWSVLASWASWRLWCWLRERHWPEHARVGAVVVAYAAAVTLALAVLPGPHDPVAVPATLLWRFRLASLAGAAVLWAVAGWTLGWLLARERLRV